MMARLKAPARLENPVRLGTVGAPHGIRGELRVKPFTEDPMALGSYGPLCTADGRLLTVADIRPAKGVVVVRFAEIGDRNAAAALNGEGLFVDRSALPEALEEEEFYHTDLVGLTVLDERGETFGRVAAVHNFGAGDLLEIRPGSGQTLMIPFTRDAVPKIDLSKETIFIDRIAAGLEESETTYDEAQPAQPERRDSPDVSGGKR